MKYIKHINIKPEAPCQRRSWGGGPREGRGLQFIWRDDEARLGLSKNITRLTFQGSKEASLARFEIPAANESLSSA